ncbi:serine/threonine protein kinase [cyanobacterium endosymbiont of Epithemia clementina EcSB]|uniref:serine/threonine protein kinase n=1 Tax=cyanobacterium endosymbiont of Epithemia clementina EcSB TaxID=3034674 RepID=UPI00248118CB|nr:protein kinase [cyanobacterium endosymbiont of Epithemia clementina EcSB]WGT67506.1 protein kinase [cyanobacterium endosymbiont of Epithemia clementina EcSB]
MTMLLSNRYQILETLGQGGFGETFLAIDTQMPSTRKCVIKQLKPTLQQSQSIPQWLQERFKLEAAVLEKLGENHPQIPCLYAYFSENNHFYLVQEWIKGETLSQVHQKRGNFSVTEVRELLCNILPILDYIHAHHIIHRDIKPDNIIIRATDGQPVLIDFGIVKEAVATMMNSNGKTAYSIAWGTPGYMPSEQAAGRPVYSSDLYSLGLTAVFLLTGKTPQYLEIDPHTGEVLWNKEIPDLDSDLTNIINRTLCFHPKDRFLTAKKMLASLNISPPTVTAATIAVMSDPSCLKPQSAPSASSSEYDSETPWALLVLGSFLIVSAIFGALTLGFILTTKEQYSPSSSPSKVPKSLELPAKSTSPSQIKRPPTPEPEVSPTPEPEVSPTPEPEVSPTPEPEVSPTPEPEVSPTPKPEVLHTDELPSIPEPTKIIPIPIESPSLGTSSQPSSSVAEPKSTPSAPDIIINIEPE